MSICPSCYQPAHDFTKDEFSDCVPPEDTLVFGTFVLDPDYRAALYKEYPFYTTEEIMSSYFGKNPNFPSQEDWLFQRDYPQDEEDEEDEGESEQHDNNE